MRLYLAEAPLQCREQTVEAGDIYMAQKGQYWLVICVNGNGASIVVYDKTGWPQSVQRYATSYIGSKQRVGKVELPTLEVEWDLNT